MICPIVKNLSKDVLQLSERRDVHGPPNRDFRLTNGPGLGEHSQIPVHLQLHQPEQQNHDPPPRAMKLGYVS